MENMETLFYLSFIAWVITMLCFSGLFYYFNKIVDSNKSWHEWADDMLETNKKLIEVNKELEEEVRRLSKK